MSRYILTKEFTFEASHQLVHHRGKCARLHGHSWKGRVVVSGELLQASGPSREMLIDYADLKAMLAESLDMYLDHHHLNDTLAFDSPTSEYVAVWLYHNLRLEIDAYNRTVQNPIKLDAVEIDETCTSSCRFEG